MIISAIVHAVNQRFATVIETTKAASQNGGSRRTDRGVAENVIAVSRDRVGRQIGCTPTAAAISRA
jgi:hypothetical protein